MVGRRLTLSDEGEGWFSGYADISGTIESVIESSPDDNSYYAVRLDAPLDLQEPGGATPSGFTRKHYSHCVIHCRWQGADINTAAPVSVHVLLVPLGTELPKSKADLAGLTIRAWAACVVRTGQAPEGAQRS